MWLKVPLINHIIRLVTRATGKMLHYPFQGLETTSQQLRAMPLLRYDSYLTIYLLSNFSNLIAVYLI